MRRVLVLLFLACAGADWERVAERDGITVERRPCDDARLRELRLTTHAPVPPAAIAAVLWKQKEFPEFVPHVKRVDVLEDHGDEKVVYQQIHVPLLKDRDVTLHATKTSPAPGTYEIATAAVPGGPPETSDYVRVQRSESHWRLVPDGGGTAVTYTIRTDPGGWVPGWVLDRVQTETAANLVRAILQRAEAKPG